MMKQVSGWLAVVLPVLGCVGTIPGTPGNTEPEPSGPRAPAAPTEPPGVTSQPMPAAAGMAPADALASPTAYGPAGVRRLSRHELAQSVQDLLGVDVRDKLEQMPVDPVSTPFDNNYLDQVPSAALVEGIKAVADAAVERLLAAPALRDRLVPCKPSAADDEVCLRRFVEKVGRSILRRPLAADEIARYASTRTLGAEAKDFFVAVEVVLRALLQSPEFVYRIEVGTPVAGTPNLLRLSGFEVAARLSYLLWGSTPSEALLDRAARGDLSSREQVRAIARDMLTDAKATARMKRLHAMWLSYEDIQAPPALAQAMRRESDALVERTALSPDGNWLDLFRAPDTFVDRTLAAHYGLEVPASGAGWISYPTQSGRKGILGHGAVLSNGQKFGKTSVVQRGLYVRERLLCEHVPEPAADLAVDVDQEPTGAGPCKSDNIRAHATKPQCAGCHRLLDPVGVGLEGFDLLGRARAKDESDCPVHATGEITHGGEVVAFSGPAQLGAFVAGPGQVDACFAQQLYGFGVGRPVEPADEPAVLALVRRFREGKHRLPDLVLEFVSAPAFFHRVPDGV